jgi:hypothetical protein
MKALWEKMGGWRWAALAGLGALLVAGGATYRIHSAAAAADAAAGAAAGPRLILWKDVAKLGVVVMANQTPITQADAKAVLPVLQELRDTKKPMDEATATAIDGKLQAALSADLKQAVSVVRLPTPSPEKRAQMRQMMQQRADKEATPETNSGTTATPEQGQCRRGGFGGRFGGRGMRMQMGLNYLIDFFQTTAQGA